MGGETFVSEMKDNIQCGVDGGVIQAYKGWLLGEEGYYRVVVWRARATIGGGFGEEGYYMVVVWIGGLP